MFEGGLLAVIWSTFPLQISSSLCIRREEFAEVPEQLLVATQINGLKQTTFAFRSWRRIYPEQSVMADYCPRSSRISSVIGPFTQKSF